MKKVLHRDFYYQIPEKSGFTRIEYQGLPGYFLVDEFEFNQTDLHAFLLKIIAALHLEVDVSLKIISCQQNSIYSIQALLACENNHIVCFGVGPDQLQLQGFEIIHHLYEFQNNKLLFANSLKSYSDEASKKILWTLLKKMFNL